MRRIAVLLCLTLLLGCQDHRTLGERLGACDHPGGDRGGPGGYAARVFKGGRGYFLATRLLAVGRSFPNEGGPTLKAVTLGGAVPLRGRAGVVGGQRIVVMDVPSMERAKEAFAAQATLYVKIGPFPEDLDIASGLVVEHAGELSFIGDCAYASDTVPFRRFAASAIDDGLANNAAALVRALMTKPGGTEARALDAFVADLQTKPPRR